MLAIGDAGDSLNAPWDLTKASTAMKFSSQDVDNDMSSVNCALQSGGGWWHNDCSHAKLMGDAAVTSRVGYQWHGLSYAGVPTSANCVLMASRMMIKAVN
jgi:hypothetical protein